MNDKGDRCPVCKGWGHTKFIGDPMKEVPAELWNCMWLADHAKKGAWPVAGGILDQSQAFMDLCTLQWGYEAQKASTE